MSDPRSFETGERERRLVGLGRALMTDITILIFVSAGAGLVVGVPLGFLAGWLVFR
jgi:hypothetical protein